MFSRLSEQTSSKIRTSIQHNWNQALRKRCLSVQATTSKAGVSRKISSASKACKSASALNATSLYRNSATSQSHTTTTSNILPLDLVLQPSVKALLPFIGNISYLALASGFLMTDMLELRVLLVGGYSGLVAFHTLHERPMRIPLRWSALFVAVNAVAAGMLIMDRYAPSLKSSQHPDGEELYEQNFAGILTRGQFHQLLALAKRQHVPAGTQLTRENIPCDSMYFIVKGQANVYHGKTAEDFEDSFANNTRSHPLFVSTIEEGGFVNDVAFQRGSSVGAYGTIITSEDSVVLLWNTAELQEHMKSKPDMERNMKYCLSDHLVKSLLRQREAAHQRQQQLQ